MGNRSTRILAGSWLAAGLLFVLMLQFARADGVAEWCCGPTDWCNGCKSIGWSDPGQKDTRWVDVGTNSALKCRKSSITSDKCIDKGAFAAQDICVCWETKEEVDLYSSDKCTGTAVKVSAAKVAVPCCEAGYQNTTMCVGPGGQ